MMRRAALLSTALGLLALPAHGSTSFKPASPVARVASDRPGSATDVYVPGRWYPLSLRAGTATTILLPPTEDVSPANVVISDRSIRIRVIGGQTVEVLPRRPVNGVALTIYGKSGHAYPFWITNSTNMPDLVVTIRDPATTPGAGDPPVGGAATVAAYQPSTPGDPGYDDPMVARVLAALPPAFRQEIADPATIAVPHQIYAKAAGDAAAIGLVRVVEDASHTYFDFGPDYAKRPRPVITFMPGGLRSTAHFWVLSSFPEVVVADQIGSFVLRYGGHQVCVRKELGRWAGLGVR